MEDAGKVGEQRFDGLWLVALGLCLGGCVISEYDCRCRPFSPTCGNVHVAEHVFIAKIRAPVSERVISFVTGRPVRSAVAEVRTVYKGKPDALVTLVNNSPCSQSALENGVEHLIFAVGASGAMRTIDCSPTTPVAEVDASVLEDLESLSARPPVVYAYAERDDAPILGPRVGTAARGVSVRVFGGDRRPTGQCLTGGAPGDCRMEVGGRGNYWIRVDSSAAFVPRTVELETELGLGECAVLWITERRDSAIVGRLIGAAPGTYVDILRVGEDSQIERSGIQARPSDDGSFGASDLPSGRYALAVQSARSEEGDETPLYFKRENEHAGPSSVLELAGRV